MREQPSRDPVPCAARAKGTAARVARMILAISFFLPHPWLSPSIAQSDDGLLVLGQSELDYLRSATGIISLSVDSVRPESALWSIARVGGFQIEIQGKLPSRPAASFKWENSTVKAALLEFARHYPVEYSVVRPDLLRVIVTDGASRKGKSTE